MLFGLIEHADDTIDRLAGVDRVQSAHNHVAGLRGRHADFDGFPVAHFADQYDLRRLPQSGAKSRRKCAEVIAHFALVEGGSFLGVYELDRVFQSDDVNRLRLIELIEESGEGRGFAASCGAGYQDQTCLFFRDRVKYRRKVELIDAGNLGRQSAKNDRVVAALREDIDAEARLLPKGIRTIARAGLYQVFR